MTAFRSPYIAQLSTAELRDELQRRELQRRERQDGAYAEMATKVSLGMTLGDLLQLVGTDGKAFAFAFKAVGKFSTFKNAAYELATAIQAGDDWPRQP